MNTTPPDAADDGIARLRFPGGRLRPADWTALAALAAAHGDEVVLATHGHLQVRGVHDEARFRRHVDRHGLPRTVVHDRARTIIASPLAGRLEGHGDVGDLPEQLDTALRAHAEVMEVADRFLFGLDDGSGDVLAHSPDLTAVVTGPGDPVRVHVAGRDAAIVVPAADAATVLVDAAVSFARRAEGARRVPSSGRLHDLVVGTLAQHPRTTSAAADPGPTTAEEAPPVGWIDTADGLVTLLAVVPFGIVPARLAEFLGAIERPSTVSADKVIGVHGLTEGMAEQVVRVLAPMGMIFDAASPWVETTA